MIDLFLGGLLGCGVTLVIVEVFSKYPGNDEHAELKADLAEAAVDYCEHKHLNRMESFQAAKWQRYVSLRTELVALTKDDGPEPILTQLRRMVAHVKKEIGK
jgi:hypothetical protein